MNCPVCQRSLTQLKFANVTVDACHGGCGGVWFDNFELTKFDEPHESDGEALLNIPVNPALLIDHRRKRPCPKCPDVTMIRHFYSPKRKVEVDQCGNCGGFWLDMGELEAIRSEFVTEAERQKAVGEFVDSVAKPYIDKMRAQGPQGVQRARQLSRLFGFVRPRAL
ncbi:MAG: zf-TFIIB domain-containing protein [Verrucomicrobiota bacterium]